MRLGRMRSDQPCRPRALDEALAPSRRTRRRRTLRPTPAYLAMATFASVMTFIRRSWVKGYAAEPILCQALNAAQEVWCGYLTGPSSCIGEARATAELSAASKMVLVQCVTRRCNTATTRRRPCTGAREDQPSQYLARTSLWTLIRACAVRGGLQLEGGWWLLSS